jgi:S-adenosyl-L-methionine hydrolase (adenosine-forming)
MHAPSGIITLLTDFGSDDPFVGVMKGVILSRYRTATIVDLCHGIVPGRVAEAAFWLERSYRYFPDGTVHVAVVDPGVGSARKSVALRAQGHYFVGPDNGTFSGLEPDGAQARVIDLAALGLAAPSRTFHGRDIFAPIAADLAAGIRPFDDVGELTTLDAARLDVRPVVTEQEIRGLVVTVDRFGNLLTNIDAELVERGAWEVSVAGQRCPLRGTYSDVPRGSAVAVVGSFGVVEVAIRDGSAKARLGADVGAAVLLSRV